MNHAPERWSAAVTAAYVPMLDRVAANAANAAHPALRRALRVEPHVNGGCLLVASNGFVAVVVHDAEGGTSRPVTVTLPGSVVAACAVPALPALLDGETPVHPDPPGWMVPDRLVLDEETAAVCGADPEARGLLASARAADGYAVRGEPYPDWRRWFGDLAPAPSARVRFDPRLTALLDPFSAEGIHLWATADGAGPFAFRLPGAHEVCGVLTGMRDTAPELDPVPDWLLPEIFPPVGGSAWSAP